MSIRYAKKEDKEQVKALWNYAFLEEASFLEYFFDQRYDKANNIVVFEEELRASLLINPYQLKHGNIKDISRYIVGISVFPEYRGRKYTTALLTKAFHELYHQGETISLLMPINTSIYRRYGYENCFDMLIYTMDMEHISSNRPQHSDKSPWNSQVERITSVADVRIKDIMRVYQQKAKNWDNYILRDEEYFKTLYGEVQAEQGEIFLCYDEKKIPQGYMIFYPKFQPEETGFVREMIVLDSRVYEVFLSLIKSHATQMTKVMIHQPEDSLFMQYMSNDNQIKQERKPFLMARVLNVKKILESLILSDDQSVSITVTDDILPQNTGTYHLSKDGIGFEEQMKQADAHLSIGDLTLLYMGRLSVSDWCFIRGKIINKDVMETLSHIFPLKISYLNDYI